jgi:YVTN family beta-propeller protein
MRIRTLALVAMALSLAACGRQKAEAPAQAARPAAYRVYVTDEGSGDLTSFEGGTWAASAPLPVGQRPRGIKTSDDHKALYVALSGSPVAPPGVDEKTLPPPDHAKDGVAVFDIAQGKVVRIMRGIPNPEQIALDRGGLVFAPSEDVESVFALNAATGAMAAAKNIGSAPEGVAVSPDGKYVYVTLEDDNQVVVLDAKTRDLVKRFNVGKRPRSVAFSPDGTRAYVTGELDSTLSIIDTMNQQVLNVLHLEGEGLKPMGVVVSPDGSRVYVTTGRGGQLLSVDTASRQVVGRAKVGQRPWGLGISPDGRFLFTANGPSNDVSVVQAADMKVVATVKAGVRPWGVTVVPQ